MNFPARRLQKYRIHTKFSLYNFSTENLLVSEKKRSFAIYYIKETSMATKKMTREEAIKRWNAAKATKKEMVEKMRKALYEEYKSRTGEEPLQFNVW